MPRSSGWTKSTRTPAVCGLGEDLPVVNAFQLPAGIVVRRTALAEGRQTQYTSGKFQRRPLARPHTRITFLRQPTHGLPEVVSSPESASFHRRDGRPFRGDPRAPIPAPDVRCGTGCSGRSPSGPQTFGYPQKRVSGTPSSQRVRHTLSIGPKAPAAFPVGHVAGARFRHPSPPPGLMRRRTKALRPRASGPRA